MNLKSFSYKYLINIPHKFINHAEYWKNEAADIHVVKCQFNIQEYSSATHNYLQVHFPPELSLAVKKRQAEFLAGRFCAKACMQSLDPALGDTVVPIGKNRAPSWPLTVIGSIAHSGTEAICAIRKSSTSVCLGIDIESVLSEADALQIGPQIHSNQELDILCRQNIKFNVASTLIFSAKESLFKALHPTVGGYFGFEEAFITNINNMDRYLTIRLDASFASTHNLINNYR
ncbi:MAG: 4'-phosphopantetheinyl transferase superfamily protein, partial [Alteromonadaceae bacterium]|nr:4'-phosphopantetheinyl transferase superfamily protein [Alteromonadaceae bacterium]